MNKIYKFVLALVLVSQTVSAQKVDTLSRVTVEAVRGDSSVRAAKTLLEKKEIDRENYGQETPIFLGRTPNVTFTSDAGSTSGYTYMRIRGIDQTRINVSLNGVPLNEPEDQAVYFSNFPDFLSNVQSVQVQRGVGGSIHGTAAYGGSVNFESLNPFSAKKTLEYSYPTQFGAQYSQTLGSTAFYLRQFNQDVDGYRDNSDNHSNSTYFSSLTVGDKSTLRITAFRGLSKNQMAWLPVSETMLGVNHKFNWLGPDEVDKFQQAFISPEYTRQVTDNLMFSVSPYYIRLNGGFTVRYTPTQLFNFNYDSNWLGIVSSAKYVYGNTRYTFGINGSNYNRTHFLVENENPEAWRNRGEKREFSQFIRADHSIGNLVLTGDVQFRSSEFVYWSDANTDVYLPPIVWTFLNPKVGASYSVDTKNKISFTLGKNSREPTRTDMFVGFEDYNERTRRAIGTDLTKVKPESAVDAELTFDRRSNKTAFQVTLFSMYFTNEITPVGEFSYIGIPLRKNIDRSTRQGLEFDGVYEPKTGARMGLNFAFQKSNIPVYKNDETDEVFTSVEPLLTPKFISNIFATYPLGPFSGTIYGRYVGQSYLDNTSNDKFIVPRHFISDAVLSFGVLPLSAYVRVNNLLNNKKAYTGGTTDGSESFYFVTPTRTLFTGLKLEF